MRRMAFALAGLLGSLTAQMLPAQDVATLLGKDNVVDVARGGGAWAAASAGQSLNIGDRVRTGEESRATVRLSDGSVLQLDELTTIEIKAPKEASAGATLSVPNGAAYFFSRGKSREVRIETPSANGAIRGTAFLLTVNGAGGGTVVSMLAGEFELSNTEGRVIVRKGEQARTGSAPAKNLYGDTGDTAPWYLVIENQLASVESLRGVSKSEFLTALPDAIKQWRFVAPQLAGAATIVRKEWARDILRESFKAVGPDCPMRARILRSIIAADPEEASALTELAIELGPDCAEWFQPIKGSGGGVFGGGTPEGTFGNPPGLNSGGGGGQGNVIAICHNGRTIFLSPSEAEDQLRNNPGDTLGACQVTPFQNL